jgi:hypothetical protein
MESLGTAQDINVYELTRETGLVPGAVFSLSEDLVWVMGYEKGDPEVEFLYGVQSYTTYQDISRSYVSVFPVNLLVDFKPPRISCRFKPKRSIQFIPEEYITILPLLKFIESISEGKTV